MRLVTLSLIVAIVLSTGFCALEQADIDCEWFQLESLGWSVVPPMLDIADDGFDGRPTDWRYCAEFCCSMFCWHSCMLKLHILPGPVCPPPVHWTYWLMSLVKTVPLEARSGFPAC